MSIEIHSFAVPAEWCDYNEHFSDCYYLIPFSHSLDFVLDSVGLGKNYRVSNDYSTYTVESHIRYLKEAKEGELLTIAGSISDADKKRLFTRHAMHRGEVLIATCEFICLHVDIRIPKAAPFPTTVLENIQRLIRSDTH